MVTFFQPFEPFMLLVGWQEGHPASKKSHTSEPERFFLGRPRVDPAYAAVISWKHRMVKRNSK